MDDGWQICDNFSSSQSSFSLSFRTRSWEPPVMITLKPPAIVLVHGPSWWSIAPGYNFFVRTVPPTEKRRRTIRR
ncbi:unnamed protein product, partial [Nesidiocoris tenuis]